MADETSQRKLERILDAGLPLEEIKAQLDASFPEGCAP